MTNQIIPVVSKDLGVINTINQVVKKSLLYYFVVRNGVVFTVEGGNILENGTHFSFIDDMEKFQKYFPIPEGHAIILNSQVIYTTIRDFKKYINTIKFEDNLIYFVTEDAQFEIGKVVSMDKADLREKYDKAKWFIPQKETETLTDDMIQTMLNNEVITYGEGDYKLRITKTLFPHIKLGLPMSIKFFGLEEEPDLFQSMIAIDKDGVTNFHVYTCVKF